ncbi:hypothetical protein F909_02637 [Acinetobacter sp. ANC 3929]|nr:hypothetical protein F909_02637 [Acinetobacter sp. ANC 3929]
MNYKIGVVLFYLLNLFSATLLVVGGEFRDLILFFIGVCLLASAFLIKYEFKLDVFFWEKVK